MKKVISFFLASSIKDVEFDRIAIGDFINQLNNIYEPHDIFIKLYKCEDESMDHSVALGGTQKSLDEIIENSDLCFVIFWRRAGEFTIHELNVAFDAFKTQNRPKIVVYFKTIPQADAVPEEIRNVMHIIDSEMLHYHREYSHIDSLKLGIVTQLQVHGFIGADIIIDQTSVKVAGNKIASTDMLPLFYENEEYMSLLKELREADIRCSELLEKYSLDKENLRIYRSYMKAVKERSRIKEDLMELADSILNIGRRIAEISSSSVITDRIREAIKRFDAGDYEGVLDILNPDEIEKNVQALDAAQDQINQQRMGIIEEYRLRILALEAQGQWQEIYSAYERAVSQVIDYVDMPKSIMLEYAAFLFRQKQYQKSIDLCEQLLSLYNLPNQKAANTEKADLLDLLGTLYYINMRYEDSERILIQAINLRRKIASVSYNAGISVGDSCVSLAKVYFTVNKHFAAESLYLEAMDIFDQYDEEGIQEVDIHIANASMELGSLYYMVNRHEDAKRLFMNAYAKYKELNTAEDGKYALSLANACNKIAYMCIALYRHKFVDRYYNEALLLKMALSKKEPKSFFRYLMKVCNKLSRLYSDHGDSAFAQCLEDEVKTISSALEHGEYDQLEKEEYSVDISFYNAPVDFGLIVSLCEEALSLYKNLAKENPEAYEPQLAQAYNTFANYYAQVGEFAQAEKCYDDAISIRQRFAKRNPQAMRTDLAISYSNLAYCYSLQGDFLKSEEYSLKTIEIYNSVAKKNANAFDTDLARNYHALANLYTKAGKVEEANKLYFDAFSLYVKLYMKSPRAYIDRIVSTTGNIAALLCPHSDKTWMQELLAAD